MPQTSTPHWVDDAAGVTADPANARDRRGPWDIVRLGGIELPGVAEVTIKDGRKIDDKSGPGRNGARLVDKGAEAARVKITLRLWTPAQLAALASAMPSLNFREERVRQTRTLTEAEVRAEAERRTTAFLDDLNIASASANGLAAAATTQIVAAGAARTIAGGTAQQTVTRRSRAAVALEHPLATLASVPLVYVQGIDYQGVRGQVLTIVIDCLEYCPRANRTSRTTAPTQRTGRSIASTPITAALQRAADPSSNSGP